MVQYMGNTLNCRNHQRKVVDAVERNPKMDQRIEFAMKAVSAESF
jgi:hypothetical protein